MIKHELLLGHTSPETAYVVEDYPFGFRLRCKIRYWLEYKKNKGFRFVSQTTNPKVSTEVWNKPKCSIYSEIAVMILMPENEKKIRQVSWTGVNIFHIEDELEPFVSFYPEIAELEPYKFLIGGYRRAIERARLARKAREEKG